ncbi:putative bifunctional diguanylate cyclase/phosphodiesterase [uncultured Friedmanniella sp.]|uniref:putative bifunctional diguanylate cyclase/phosphodiesterase n=1 Tax=uncultured Friedmanniella sp. TaxID=335381 RepID=UPI0035C98733
MSSAPLTADPPAVSPLMSFDEAAQHVLDHLRTILPFNFWTVSQYDAEQDRQVYLHVRDVTGRVSVGDFSAWSHSFCQHMVSGVAPQIAADVAAVPQYAAIRAADHLDIGSYVGVPIRASDGRVFGTLCGTDPQAQPAGSLDQHAPLLQLLASLLGQILAGERLQAEAEEREATLRWRAFHDELTGLPNRALFNDRLSHALTLHRRDLRPLAVLTLDVDDFKAINDAFGHPGGDELLVRLAERLRGAVRAGDTLARLGGDEFAILLENTGGDDHASAAATVAERVLGALVDPFSIGGRTVSVGVSVGIADVDADAGSPTASALLTHADVALYTAKREGKARATVYEPAMQLPEARDLELREPLRAAIAGGLITSVYQPIVALDTGTVVDLECLARWTHEGVPISPDTFIPLAARSRLLTGLTDLMVDRACTDLRRWSGLPGHQRLRVAVNVPPGLLTDPTFPARIAGQVQRAGLHPRQLTLEITEDALLHDLGTARAVADELHDLGFSLSLDDFGTGYSSLLHLRSIPLDSVKIDRGFTSDVDTNPRTQRFLRALVTMGHDLDLQVIVEGVEREAQATVLRRLGATHAQGYLYARPRPAAELDLTVA